MSSEQNPVLRSPEAEIHRLLGVATAEYAKGGTGGHLVAIPCGFPDGIPTTTSVPLYNCDDDDPDQGKIRGGKFVWSVRCCQGYDFVDTDKGTAFGIMHFTHSPGELEAFSTFAKEAGAALLASAPPWLPKASPPSAARLWAIALFFLSPTSKHYVPRTPKIPLFMPNVWAASIAALRDILDPPVSSSQPSAGSPHDKKSPKVGRPPDPRRKQIIVFVCNLRSKKATWPSIHDAVFTEFNVKLGIDTLRKYARGV